MAAERVRVIKFVALCVFLAVSVLVAVLVAVDRKAFSLFGRKVEMGQQDPEPKVLVVDLSREVGGVLPRYVDVNVGDIIQVTDRDGNPLEIRVRAVQVENKNYSCPRTRIELEADEVVYAVQCGMRACDGKGGIGPTRIGRVSVSGEITELLFSRMPSGTTRFNAYDNFRLGSHARLAIWDASTGVLGGLEGNFVVKQPEWPREKYGNWLHKTYYGMHAAVDVFSEENGRPQSVLAPLDAVVLGVFAKDAEPDSRKRIKAVYLVSGPLGTSGERLYFRMLHLSKIVVEAGQRVEKGQVLGLTGHTGFDPVVGDHLHFEVRLNPCLFGGKMSDRIEDSVPVNPYPYLLEWWDTFPRNYR